MLFLRKNVPWIVAIVSVVFTFSRDFSCNAYAASSRVDKIESRLDQIEKRIDAQLERIADKMEGLQCH
jgi:hypothetical protein